jgi:AcrR family transcriptional regulator
VESPAEWKARPGGADYDAQRRRVVEAAESIVRDQGVGSLRLDSVAAAVGLHRSSLYRYFDSKEELITAVVVQATMRVGRKVISQLGADAAPEQFLVEGLVIALAELANDPVHRSLMAPTSSEAMARVGSRALTEGIAPLVEPMFVTAAAQGILREGVTPEVALRWLQIVAAGLLQSPTVTTDRAALTELLEAMLVPALLRS